jgi:hypothetical protein
MRSSVCLSRTLAVRMVWLHVLAEVVGDMRQVIPILVLTTLAYLPILWHPFAYEDFNFLHASPSQSLRLDWVMPSRNLTAATWSADPRTMHAGNLGLHLLNGSLVYALASSLEIGSPWLAAGIFLLHPLNSEAVAYAAGRGELLVTLGILIATICASLPTSALTLFGILLGSWIAMSAKEIGVVAVGLVSLVWWYQGRIHKWAWLALLPLGVVAGRGIPYILRYNADATLGFPDVTFPTWWGWQASAVWRYVSLTIFPVGLSVMHDVEHSPGWMGALAVSLLVGVAVGVGVLAWRRRIPEIVFCLAWILIVLAPRFAVRIPLQTLTEHHWLITSPAWAMLIAHFLGGSDEGLHRGSVRRLEVCRPDCQGAEANR